MEGPKPAWADWDIDREVRGTFVFDRTFKGAGIARTPDSRNEARYETWLADKRNPLKMRVNDVVHYYGPLFEARNIRFDTSIFQCPPKSAPTEDGYLDGYIQLPILQLDYQTGEFLWEMPTYIAKGYDYFIRKFVKGDKKWVATKPLEVIGRPVDFTLTSGLNFGNDWAHVRGKFTKGQETIDLSRKFVVRAVTASLIPKPLNAEMKCVLNRVRK